VRERVNGKKAGAGRVLLWKITRQYVELEGMLSILSRRDARLERKVPVTLVGKKKSNHPTSATAVVTGGG